MKISIFFKLFLIYFPCIIISFSEVIASSSIANSNSNTSNFLDRNKDVIPKAFYIKIAMFKSENSPNEAHELLEKFMSEFKVNYYDKMQIAYVFRDVRLLRNIYYSYLKEPASEFLYKNHMYDFIQKCKESVVLFDFFSNNKELLYHDSCKFYDNLKNDVLYLVMMVYAFHEANDIDRFNIAYNKLMQEPVSNNFTTDVWRLKILRLIGKDKEANLFSKEIRKIYTDKSCQDILDICESEENKDIESNIDWSFK